MKKEDWLKFADSLENQSGVYLITNTLNNKVYVGISTDLKFRLKTHIHKLCKNKHHNYHLQNSFNTYGIDNFTIQIIEFTENNDKILLQRESYYQALYKATSDDFGYNITKTNIDGSIRHSEESKRKISLAHKGRPKTEETREKLRLASFGKPGYKHNEEHKKYMSDIMKNRVISEETRQKISAAKIGIPSPLKGKKSKSPSEETRLKMSITRKGSGNSRALKVILEDGRSFGCIKDAARALNMTYGVAIRYIKKNNLLKV